MRFVAPDRGSTRITLEDPAPATQTDPSPTSTPRGPGPTAEPTRVTRSVAILLALGAILVAGSAALSRSGSGLALPEATSAGCKNVGWIAKLNPRAPHAYLRLAGTSKSCTCPGKGCARLAKYQHLFANETIFSGGGTIKFKSVVKGVPNMTCIVARNSTDVIYPQASMGPRDRAVLQVVSGATSGCENVSTTYFPSLEIWTEWTPLSGVSETLFLPSSPIR